MTFLLDGNVLVAPVVADHIHHGNAEQWLAETSAAFATCPITQGTLVRLLVRDGQTASAARDVVAAITSDSRHDFWSDSISFDNVG